MAQVALRIPESNYAQAQRDIRVEDFLNDKLQTTADLGGIDGLLEDVRKQQTLLKQQLQEARASLKADSDNAEDHERNIRIQAQSFQARQADIDLRLRIVTQSEASDDAVEQFESIMESLQNLDVAQGYVKLLKEVQNLSDEARANFKKLPHDALEPYLRLQQLANALKERQPAAEGAAPHLLDHVERNSKIVWIQMKDSFAHEFEATLKKMKWPGKDLTMAGSLEAEWTEGVKKLLDLQGPELNARDKAGVSTAEDPLVLLPLEVMARPLALRFKYHFEGDRPTNKLDKPEYFLSHFVGLLNTYDEFFARYFQPILRDHFAKSNLALTSIYIDSTSALITAMLPMLREKLHSLLPQLSNHSQLLSHLIHELMSFDISLRDEWSYDGGRSIEGWKGLTWEVLVKLSWFPRWLSVEKEFALARFHTIVENAESFEIDHDSETSIATKPTHAAIRINDLLETITDRYRNLTSFSQKVQFLIDVQIAILDLFHNRLRDSLSAYQTLTSSIGRNIQGASRETRADLQGKGGLERLCRIYGSTDYLERKLSDYNDDVFFIELWDELQYWARLDRGDKNLAGPMSLEHVAERTSSAVGTDEDSGALFDETAQAYRRLRVRAEDVIQDRLVTSMREILRPYGRINPWSSLALETPSSLALTAELDATVQFLNDNIGFLANVLGQAPLRRMVRQVTLAIQTFLYDNVLLRYVFSTAGVAQLKRDIEAVWYSIDRWVGDGQAESGMRRLKDALALLTLPVYVDEDDASDAIGPGLWEVEERIFANNESARETLQELGLENLIESDARNVLGRRIELSSG